MPLDQGESHGAVAGGEDGSGPARGSGSGEEAGVCLDSPEPSGDLTASRRVGASTLGRRLLLVVPGAQCSEVAVAVVVAGADVVDVCRPFGAPLCAPRHRDSLCAAVAVTAQNSRSALLPVVWESLPAIGCGPLGRHAITSREEARWRPR